MRTSRLLLIAAVVLFVLSALGLKLGIDLDTIGLALFAGSFLVK